jgi:molecular chaperone Hsp33
MSIRIKKIGKRQSSKGLQAADYDVVQPFRLEKSNVRGRMVRLGPVLAEIMNRHDYPPPVAALLSEAATLCVLLSSMMKYEGVFTLQIKGDGPIRLLVVDVTSKGELRAQAGFDAAAVKKLAKRKKDTENHYYHLVGKGYIAFTVDQDNANNRYQGIVELKGQSLIDAVQHYFTQSEQIKTAVHLSVHPQDGQWRTGAIMIQQMPEEGGNKDEEIIQDDDLQMEDWTRAVSLLKTCTEAEMLSPKLHSTDMLFRLFHEDGVRVYPQRHIRFGCRCSREKVINVLKTIPEVELHELCKKEGKVSITCQFCSQEYAFLEQDIQEVFANAPDTSKS